MTRAQKIAKAEKLRAQGLTYKAIGQRFGVSPSCVVKWLNPEQSKEWNRRQNERPERVQANREWQLAHRLPCPKCGGLMARAASQCRECRQAADRARHFALGKQVERWWREGETHDDIAQRLGWSLASGVGVLLYRLRSEGFDLPYRYHGKVNGTKFPELRKAA